MFGSLNNLWAGLQRQRSQPSQHSHQPCFMDQSCSALCRHKAQSGRATDPHPGGPPSWPPSWRTSVLASILEDLHPSSAGYRVTGLQKVVEPPSSHHRSMLSCIYTSFFLLEELQEWETGLGHGSWAHQCSQE